MNSISILQTEQDCKLLSEQLNLAKPTICLWATGQPRQTVDILIYLRNALIACNYQVIFFIRASGLDFFKTLYEEKNFNLIYQCDDYRLLQYCNFIDLLFMHDFIFENSRLNYSPYVYLKLSMFQGKVALFPHALTHKFPDYSNFWADYILAPNTPEHIDFDFSKYTNEIKRSKPSSLRVIPCGYLKFDLAIKELQKNANTHKYLAYFPIPHRYLTNYGGNPKHQYSELEKFITMFLDAHKTHTFVLRPSADDRDSTYINELQDRFQNNARFMLDLASDNLKYMVSADILMTDYSAIDLNYAYTTLKPSICLQVRDFPQEIYGKTKVGYIASTAELAMQYCSEIFDNKEAWQNALLKERKTDICNFGTACTYICSHIDAMLQNKQIKDSVEYNKGDTPYEKLTDFLKCFSVKQITNNTSDIGQLINLPNLMFSVAKKSFPQNKALILNLFS